MNVRNASAHQVSTPAVTAVTEYLTILFQGSATFGVADEVNEASADPSSVNFQAQPIVLFRQDDTTLADNETMQFLRQSSNSTHNISALASNVASGYSSYLRTALPAADDALYSVIVHTSNTVILVYWGFLAFPCGLVVAGHAFLFITMLQNKWRAVPS